MDYKILYTIALEELDQATGEEYGKMSFGEVLFTILKNTDRLRNIDRKVLMSITDKEAYEAISKEVIRERGYNIKTSTEQTTLK